MRSHFDARLQRDNELQQRIEGRLGEQTAQVGDLQKQLEQQKKKSKERFQKVNEALAALEKYLDAGNRKVDKLVNSEIHARWVLPQSAQSPPGKCTSEPYWAR